jgi:DNA-binding NarL/FixJ family response regulator
VIEKVQMVLDDDAYECAWRAGESLSLADAIAEALVVGTTSAAPLSPAAPDPPSGHQLTVREAQILQEIVAGKSNKEIAAMFFVSPRTVERHIANIYLKIGVHNKAEATAYALRRSLA